MEIYPSISTNNLDYQNNTINPTSFTSKKSLLKELDNLNRLTMREFPVYSNTKIERYNIKGKLADKLYKYSAGLVDEIRGFSSHDKNRAKRVFRSLDAVKRLKVGNCSELADAAYIACKVNGVKDVKILSLYALDSTTGKMRELDHVMVGVNFHNQILSTLNRRAIYGKDKNAVIIDPWLGFVDYERNASTHYKNDAVFGKKLSPTEKICYLEEKKGIAELKSGDFLYLGKKYKGLCKRENSLFEKMKWFFLDKRRFKHEQIPLSVKDSYRRTANFKNALSQQDISRKYTDEANKNMERRRLLRAEQIKMANSFFYRIRCHINDYMNIDI